MTVTFTATAGSNTQTWIDFFLKFSELLRADVDSYTAHALSANIYADFFHRFSSGYADFKKSGGAINVWDIAGIGRDELRNCSLLAWLLDCSGSHGQGEGFLSCFLDCVQRSGCPVGFPGRSAITASYRTMLESSYDEEEQSGKQRSRVDIELDGNAFLILIEAKIQAGEGEKQLARYLRIGRTRAGNLPWGLAFVTPTGRGPVEKEVCGKVACVSWRTLGRSFLRHAETMPETHGSIIIRQICEHFISL